MPKKAHVRSLYSKMLVTSYEYEGKIYVANQHGHFDVYDGEYTHDKRTGTLRPDSPEMKNIIALARKKGL